jgi:hypothetical protein
LVTEDSSGASVISLKELIAINTEMLKQGLSQGKLPFDLAKSFPRNEGDKSPFEKSGCSSFDSIEALNCGKGATSGVQKSVALIGDSKMSQFAQPFIDYFLSKGWRVSPLIMDGCTIYKPNNTFKKNCVKRSEWVLSQVEQNNYDLVVGATYPTGSEGSEYLDSIVKAAKKTILLVQFPKVVNPAGCIKEDFSYPESCSQIVSWEVDSYRATTSFIKSKANSRTHVVDTTSWTCIELMCPIALGDVMVNRDGSHLTYSFIKKITPIIDLTLDSIANW